ncbi:hypothetical protein UFOVP116_151 [uncultured Caudovirales phage]|uniref:Uncharacterized protein n=1 Tax=uncultured Caudovirales phage TaxID=2100421 RepID=A0A6J5L969_9CAUD|nr:hypothetical protein UFOVP116_151 [uncultured Caudovirales phage]
MRKEIADLLDEDGRITAFPEPVWAKNMTREKQYALYLQVKAALPKQRQIMDVKQLEEAIAIYEKNNGIA